MESHASANSSVSWSQNRNTHELQRIQFQGSEIISAVVAIALTEPQSLATAASTTDCRMPFQKVTDNQE